MQVKATEHFKKSRSRLDGWDFQLWAVHSKTSDTRFRTDSVHQVCRRSVTINIWRESLLQNICGTGRIEGIDCKCVRNRSGFFEASKNYDPKPRNLTHRVTVDATNICPIQAVGKRVEQISVNLCRFVLA